MGDFVEQTAVEAVAPGHYRAALHEDWRVWGPGGGYVASIALRAAGAASRLARPVSFHCQYLRVGRFEEVQLETETLHSGRRTEALRVTMRQGDDTLLVASVWTAGEGEGLVHDHTRPPEVPDPGVVPTEEERSGREPHGFHRNLEVRNPFWVPREALRPGEPVLRGWYRFRPRAVAPGDPFADACRAVILLDTFSWPAIYGAHPDTGGDWIAPNLDLYVRFHRSAEQSEQLLLESRADLAEDGLIATDGRVWTEDRQLAASAHSHLFCRPRPERFR